jgi:hypothetical protein
MAEPTIFQEGTFQVTRRRVLLDGQQYSFDSIRSVQIGTVRIQRILAIPAILFGVGSCMVSQLNGSLVWFVAGLVAFAFVGYLWWRANRTYTLILGTTEGDRQVLTSNDRQLIERAAQTIDALLVERGRR